MRFTQNVLSVSGDVIVTVMGSAQFAKPDAHFVHDFTEMRYDQRAFDQGVVRDYVHGARTLAPRHRKQKLENQVRYERAVLAAGKTDDPGMVMRLEILSCDLAFDIVQNSHRNLADACTLRQ